MELPLRTGAVARSRRGVTLGVSLPSALDKRYGYHVARRQARLVRRLYAGPLAHRLDRPVEVTAELDVHLVGFSGERDALEQLASLRSVLRHLGRPARFTLGSDGSHTSKTLGRLSRQYPGLEVVSPSEYVTPDLPVALRDYAARHPLGKKLAFMASLRPESTMLYADADVLFFPGAAALRELLADVDGPPRYLLDCSYALDERVLPSDLTGSQPVNSGFWIIRQPLGWEEALSCLDRAAGEFAFHTEQTVFHVAMHRAGGVPVDPDQCVMQVDDRFDYRTVRERDQIALRHYVSNIRHHFWRNLDS